MNVVALERDHKQFKALTERLTSEAAAAEQAIKQAATEEASLHLLSQLASRFTKLKPDVVAHFAAAAEEDLVEQSVSSSVVESIGVDEVKPSWVGCDKPVAVRDEAICARAGCVSGKMHAGCCERCCKCGKLFCNSEHTHDHGCSL